MLSEMSPLPRRYDPAVNRHLIVSEVYAVLYTLHSERIVFSVDVCKPQSRSPSTSRNPSSSQITRPVNKEVTVLVKVEVAEVVAELDPVEVAVFEAEELNDVVAEDEIVVVAELESVREIVVEADDVAELDPVVVTVCDTEDCKVVVPVEVPDREPVDDAVVVREVDPVVVLDELCEEVAVVL